MKSANEQTDEILTQQGDCWQRGFFFIEKTIQKTDIQKQYFVTSTSFTTTPGLDSPCNAYKLYDVQNKRNPNLKFIFNTLLLTIKPTSEWPFLSVMTLQR